MAANLGWGLIGGVRVAQGQVMRSFGQPPRELQKKVRATQAGRALLEVRQLRYFVSICDSGSLSKASEKLSVAQSALSAQLAHLEAELGAVLVHRSRSGVVPTESGRILYEHARVILRQVDDAKSAVRQSCDHPKGVVNIGLSESISAVLGLALLRAIKDRFSAVTLHLHEDICGTLVDQLKGHRLDLAVLFTEGELEGLTTERLVKEKLYLISSRPSKGAVMSNSVNLADALRSPLILPGMQHGVRARIEEYARAAGHPISNLVAETDSLTVTKNAVLDGMGMTVLPVSAVMSEIDHDLMRAQEIFSPGMTCTVALCSPKDTSASQATQCVAGLITSVVTEIVAAGRWPGAELAQDDHCQASKPRGISISDDPS